ncbi:MAG: hypothetical protein WA958_06055 [Tunicatimonas sp.]
MGEYFDDSGHEDYFEQLELEKNERKRWILEHLEIYNKGQRQRINLHLGFFRKQINVIADFLSIEHQSEGLKLSDSNSIFSKTEVLYYNQYDIPMGMHYNAYLISLFSFWDFQLKRYSSILRYVVYRKNYLNDLQGKDNMSKCYYLIKNSLGIDVAKIDSEWNKLRNYQNVRNLIVHYDSNTKKAKKNSSRIVTSNQYLTYNETTGHFYINDRKLLLKFCDTINDFFRKLINQSYNCADVNTS